MGWLVGGWVGCQCSTLISHDVHGVVTSWSGQSVGWSGGWVDELVGRLVGWWVG